MTVTSDRPSGPFPKLSGPVGHPYPHARGVFAPSQAQLDIEALAAVPPRPTFTPRETGEGDERLLSLSVHQRVLSAMQREGWPSHADVEPRYPSVGQMVEAQRLAVHDLPPLDVRRPGEALRRVKNGLSPVPDAVPAPVPVPNFAPAPQAPPEPSPVAGWPEGVVRGLLIAALWDACRWYGDMNGAGCTGCEAAGGPCEWHAPRHTRYFEYEELHDFAVDAQSDAGALAAVANSVRLGTADVADLASPGSHLDLILAGALADGGAR